MSYTRSVALNTIVQLVGRVVTTATSLVLVAALTRYLGVDAFGKYTTVFAYVAFLGTVADFGFFWIMVREIAQVNERKVFDKIVSNVLTLRTFLGIAVFGLGALATWLIPQYGVDVRIGVAIVSFAWLATALNSTFVGVFQNKLRMDKAVITDVVGRTIILLLVIWMISRGDSLTTIFVSYAFGTYANLFLSFLLGREYVTVKPAFDFALWKRIFIEAFPMGIVLILHVVYFRIDSVMLSLMRGTTDVGIYGAPYKILEVLITLPVMFLGNVFPMLSRLLTEKSERVPGMIQRSFDALLTIALPLTVGGMLLAEPIVRFVAGDEFVHASTLGTVFGQPATAVLVLQILMGAVGITFISNLFNYIMIALGKQRSLVLPYAVFVLVNVGVNLLIIPTYSYVGAAFSTLLTELVVMTYLGVLAIRATDVKLNFSIAWRIVVCTAVMGAFLSLARLSLWAEFATAIALYGVLAYALGVVTPDLLRQLVKRSA